MTSSDFAVGRLLVVGFDGTEPPAELLDLLRGDRLGGVILFSRNIESPEQVASLIARLADAARAPFAVLVDQEGGSVQRLGPPVTQFPEMARVGETNDPDLAYRIGQVMAAELSCLGISWNLAPVLDVDSNPDNPVIGRRAFGRDPERVARIGLALARGLEDAGVLSCAKHFPGHGDTREDSHLTLPRVDHPEARLGDTELAPFRSAARAGVVAMMTAHVLYPAWDAVRPATLSSAILQGVLRGQLGYGGLIVGDDLEMKAIAARYEPEEAATRAVAAGIDVLLLCQQLGRAPHVLESLRRAYAAGGLTRERVDAAARRIDAAYDRFELPRRPHPVREIRALLGCEAHRQVAAASAPSAS